MLVYFNWDFICIYSFYLHFFRTTLRYRLKIIRFLEHIDLIGEDRHWIGGIASSGIFVLVFFTGLFSIQYINQYPIEDINGDSSFSCDSQIINRRFTNGLQLLALPKSDEELPIFNLLDEQPFILKLDLINTFYISSIFISIIIIDYSIN